MGVLQVGSTFSGRYRVLHFLAEGGMGSAWVGEDLKSHSLLVFKEPKLMGQPQSDRLNSEKLNIEGYILRYLSHKNIVKFVDLIQVKNIPILVTGFIDGEIIEKVTAARPFEEKIAVKHAIALLEALSYIQSLT
jgi:serine/threonine protein kinase